MFLGSGDELAMGASLRHSATGPDARRVVTHLLSQRCHFYWGLRLRLRSPHCRLIWRVPKWRSSRGRAHCSPRRCTSRNSNRLRPQQRRHVTHSKASWHGRSRHCVSGTLLLCRPAPISPLNSTSSGPAPNLPRPDFRPQRNARCLSSSASGLRVCVCSGTGRRAATRDS